MASFRRAALLSNVMRSNTTRMFGTVPSGREPLLFTPGPLTTSISVKQEMLRDLGSRDPQFISLVREVREELLKLANTSQEDGSECVLVPGSGTTTVERVFSTITATTTFMIAKVVMERYKMKNPAVTGS